MSTGRRFPDVVPVLVDTDRGVRLRPHRSDDLPAIVEQATDPESVRFTTVPTPYGLEDARTFLADMVIAGWESGRTLGWAIEAGRGPGPAFCGSIDLRLADDRTAEVGFALHPAARGRGVMSAALRLVRDYGLDSLGLHAIRWRAILGNWNSRKVAAAAAFRFDGTVRGLLNHRGELRDGWFATITADDPREPLRWLEPPRLTGGRVRLRPLAESDLERVVETCRDPRTRHWLVSLPTPYDRADAAEFLEAARERAAQSAGLLWCVADIGDDRCLGSVALDGYAGYSGRGEIGYWAHPDARGQGRVTEAVQLVAACAEQSRLTTSLQIRCAAGNRASCHVAEAAGFAPAGRLPGVEPLGDGSWDDLVLYSRRP
jgi:ribosomal-protein-alanine N-acetyltransferase